MIYTITWVVVAWYAVAFAPAVCYHYRAKASGAYKGDLYPMTWYVLSLPVMSMLVPVFFVAMASMLITMFARLLGFGQSRSPGPWC